MELIPKSENYGSVFWFWFKKWVFNQIKASIKKGTTENMILNFKVKAPTMKIMANNKNIPKMPINTRYLWIFVLNNARSKMICPNKGSTINGWMIEDGLTTNFCRISNSI